jgi:FkbM family methyltransferase
MRRYSKSVVAFEPNPELAARLARLMRLVPSVTVHGSGLSDRDESTMLRIPTEKGWATLEAANTLPGREAREVPVRVRRLDGFGFPDVGFIKIDVEGHELAVLRGAERLLRTARPNLLIEAAEEHRPGAFSSVRDFLTPLGYVGAFMREGTLIPLGPSDPAPDGVQNFVFRA